MKSSPLLFYILFFFSACSHKPAIVGTWKPVEMEMPGVPENEKREMLSSAELQFNEDNTYISIGADGIRRTGKYEFDEKNKILIMNAGLKPGERSQLVSIKKNK